LARLAPGASGWKMRVDLYLTAPSVTTPGPHCVVSIVKLPSDACDGVTVCEKSAARSHVNASEC
jgi:hypothetical protein